MGYESGIKWFLLVNWILAMSPVYISSSNNSVSLRSHWPQLGFYFLFLLLHANFLITTIREHVSGTKETPAGYITFLNILLCVTFQLDLQRIVWTKRDKLGKLAKKLQDQRQNVWPLGFNRIKMDLISVAACVCNFIIGIITALIQIIPYIGDTPATQNMMNAYHAQLGKYKLFILAEFPNLSASESDLSWSELGFCTFSMIQHGIGTVQSCTGDFLVFGIVITMWICVDRFEKIAEEFCNEEVKKIFATESSEIIFVVSENLPKVTLPRELRFKKFYHEFQELQELFEISNDIFGSLMFQYIIMSVTFYALSLGSVFRNDGFFLVLSRTYPLLLYCTSLLLSANIGTKMNRVKEFLLMAQEDHKLFPVEQFSNLIRRIERKYVAVSAYGCFTVDYSVVLNVVTTTTTYYIIMADAVKEALNNNR